MGREREREKGTLMKKERVSTGVSFSSVFLLPQPSGPLMTIINEAPHLHYAHIEVDTHTHTHTPNDGHMNVTNI